jgi:hypothetical protein
MEGRQRRSADAERGESRLDSSSGHGELGRAKKMWTENGDGRREALAEGDRSFKASCVGLSGPRPLTSSAREL